MLIAGLVLAILFGWVLGGSLRQLAKLPVRHVYLLILSFVMEAAQSQLMLRVEWMTPLLSFCMTILQYLLLFLFIYLNGHMWQVLVCGAGAALNFVAITANAGAMPLTEKVMELGGTSAKFAAMIEGRFFTYQLVDESTRLPFLGDVILIPGPLPQCISIGDILLVGGLFCLVVGGMRKTKGTEEKI